MRKRIKSFEDLRDSQLLYDSNIPRFGYMIILIFSLILIIGTIWSVVTPKTEILISSGIVQSKNKNYIMSSYIGEITSINISEGKSVKKGDVLLSIKSAELNLQREQLQGQKEVSQEKVKQLRRLVEAIKTNKNCFNQNSENESQYYNQYEAYQSQIAQNRIDTSAYKNYGYNDAQIEAEVQKNEKKITEIYYSTLKAIHASIDEVNTQIANIDVQLGAVNNGQQEYQIRANESGVVHMMGDYKKGMVVQAASAIGSIVSEQDEYMVVANVSVSDRSRIKVGDSVDMMVSGLIQSIYGTLSGKITRIDSDITRDSEKGNSYFKVEITPENKYLVSKEGNKVNISDGMAVETRIQYDEVTYFNYVLESLGILTR